MTYREATRSGSRDIPGNAERMSVKTLERGWLYWLLDGFRSDDTDGYRGPMTSWMGIPSAMRWRRSERKLRSRESRAQDGSLCLIGLA